MKKIFMERQEGILRTVIKENDEMKEFFFQEESQSPLPGEIYKGIVKKIVPAINSAFIDIGVSKNVYMHINKKMGSKEIKNGDEIIVEVIKEEIGDKGAKVTANFTIPGAYSVLNGKSNKITFSKRIEDISCIKNIKENIVKPNDVGITIRSNAQNVDIKFINEEIEKLYDIYKKIITEGQYSLKPKKLYSDEGVMGRIIRDFIHEDDTSLIVNDKRDYDTIKSMLKQITDSKINLNIHEEDRELFDFYGIEKEILSLRKRVVQLNCGGYIVIDKTEAMYVIDVNSGKNTNNRSIKDTAKITNMEAAKEVAKQVRLRNLSGIIVVDFIDIKSNKIKEEIISILKKNFIGDKNKTQIFSFTDLNLVQITRRRKGNSIYEYVEEEYSGAFRRGSRIKYTYICNLLKNEIRRINNENNIKDIYIELDEIYKNDIQQSLIHFIKKVKAEDKRVYLKFSSSVDKIHVRGIIFENELKKIQCYKIYG